MAVLYIFWEAIGLLAELRPQHIIHHIWHKFTPLLPGFELFANMPESMFSSSYQVHDNAVLVGNNPCFYLNCLFFNLMASVSCPVEYELYKKRIAGA